MWSNGEHEQALHLLESLPAELRSHDELAHLHAHFSLALAAESAAVDAEARAADPEDAEACFQLAALQLARDDMAAALATLDDLDAGHPQYRSGLPRQALLALFAILGSEHPLTRQYRARLPQRLR